MHYARIANSPRLQRTLHVLQQVNDEISTFELSRRAAICAVNSVISELRKNGYGITCRQAIENGQRVFYYQLTSSPEHPHEKTPH